MQAEVSRIHPLCVERHEQTEEKVQAGCRCSGVVRRVEDGGPGPGPGLGLGAWYMVHLQKTRHKTGGFHTRGRPRLPGHDPIFLFGAY